MTLPDIALGRSAVVVAGGTTILLCRSVNGLHASAAICPHQNRSLEGARVRGARLLCPWHGAKFDLATGAALSPDLTDRPLAIYRCEERAAQVVVNLD